MRELKNKIKISYATGDLFYSLKKIKSNIIFFYILTVFIKIFYERYFFSAFYSRMWFYGTSHLGGGKFFMYVK